MFLAKRLARIFDRKRPVRSIAVMLIEFMREGEPDLLMVYLRVLALVPAVAI
jgi:hypothetical protein